MDASQYIDNRLDRLRDRADELLSVREGVTNDFDTWSALKLLLHASVVDMYTRVHKNQETDDIFYIDALAGSGISSYKAGQGFIGSPLLACREAQMPFTKMFLIEHSDEHAEALEERLKYAFSLSEFTEPECWEVYSEDANEAIKGINSEMDQLSGNFEAGDTANYYCFIDNQATDVDWGFIEEITPFPYGDLLINIPIASAIGRNFGSAEVNDFYGCDTSHFQSRKEALNVYESKVRERRRPVTASTTVDGGVGSFEYEVLYATRCTDGGSEYVRRVEAVRDFLEQSDGEHVKTRLNVTEGPQGELSDWMPNSDVEFPEEEDDSQTGLDDWI